MIDCSDNLNLLKAWKEKPQYYSIISSFVNSAVLYHENQVQIIDTISDLKSHKAEVAWASTWNFQSFRFSEQWQLVADSSLSQYRNQKNVLA